VTGSCSPWTSGPCNGRMTPWPLTRRCIVRATAVVPRSTDCGGISSWRLLLGTLSSQWVGEPPIPWLITGGAGLVDGPRAYYNDTPTHRTDVFDYDTESRLSGRCPFAEIAAEVSRPDGLTVDEQGGVWVALSGGGTVRRYTPDVCSTRLSRWPPGKSPPAHSAAPMWTNCSSPRHATALNPVPIRWPAH
jgi:hypothetical protein